MRRLSGWGGLWALAVAALLVPGRPAAAGSVERPALSGPVQCQGNDCNGKFPSANGCVADGHAPDDSMVYRIAAFDAYDPGHHVYGALYYSAYCHAVFGEYTTDDPEDRRFLGIYRMNNYGGTEQGYDRIAVTAPGTYRTQMVGYDDNQAKFCAGATDADPDFSAHDANNPFPCTGWR